MRAIYVSPAALVIGLAAAALGGCAESMQWHGWSEPPRARPASKYPRDAAVTLYIEEKYLESYTSRSDNYTRKEHREARAILTEKGIEDASIRLGLPKNWRLRWVHARTVQPDGTFQEVPASDILVDTSSQVGDERLEVTTWRIRFPSVRVGSVIECAYSIQNKAFLSFAWDRPSDEYPILHYSRELTVDRPLRFVFKLYNSAAPVIAHMDHDPARIRFELADIPARSRDPYLPPWTTREPFWLFRVQQVAASRVTLNLSTTWEEAVAELSRRLSGERANLFDGAPSIQPADGCRDVRCRLTWAIDQARERAEWTGFDEQFRPLPVKRVLALGVGDDGDKAVVLLRLLRAAGVQVEPAFVGQLADPDFPFPRLLSRPLLRVAAQQDLNEPLWIDPACEHCAAGELMPEVLGARALVLEVHGRVLATNEHKARFETVTGQPARMAITTRTCDLTLDERGNAQARVETVAQGSEAAEWRRTKRTNSPDGWQRDAERFVTERVPSASLTSFEPPMIDRAAGQGRQVISFHAGGYATVDGDRLLVPLTVLRSPFDDRFTRQHRSEPIEVKRPRDLVERIRLTLPAGYRLADRPPELTRRAGGFSIVFTVEDAGGHVIVERSVSESPSVHGPDQYPAVRSLVRDFTALRDGVLVLRRAP